MAGSLFNYDPGNCVG